MTASGAKTIAYVQASTDRHIDGQGTLQYARKYGLPNDGFIEATMSS